MTVHDRAVSPSERQPTACAGSSPSSAAADAARRLDRRRGRALRRRSPLPARAPTRSRPSRSRGIGRGRSTAAAGRAWRCGRCWRPPTLDRPASTRVARSRPSWRALERGSTSPASARRGELEDVNAALVRLKDAVWAVRRDRLRTAAQSATSPGRDAGVAADRGAARRCSSRCRRSTGSRCAAATPRACTSRAGPRPRPRRRPRSRSLVERARRPAVRRRGRCATHDGALSFVYKAAAEIGELGDNTAVLRARDHERRAAAPRARWPDSAEATVLGHTRWASVGIIVAAERAPAEHRRGWAVATAPYVVAALNGDVDNYADLKAPRRCASRPRSPPTPR